MFENCDACHRDYAFAPETAKLVLFLNYLKASHVEAHCPNCGVMEIIYTTPQSFLHILQECHLGVSFGYEPTAERREACDVTWGSQGDDDDEVVYTSEAEADVPHWMLRELFDQLRDYERSN